MLALAKKMIIDRINIENWTLPEFSSFHLSKIPAVFLCGIFEYYCLATGDAPFHDGFRLRRGLALFLPRHTPRNLKIAVKGIRLASARDEFMDGESAFVTWKGCGTLVDDSGMLHLSYHITNDGEKGTTTDEFRFFAADGLPAVISGKFSQTIKGCEPTTGEVFYSKLTNSQKLEQFVKKYVANGSTGKIRSAFAEEELAPSAEIVLAEIQKSNPPAADDKLALLDFLSGCCIYSKNDNALSVIKDHFDPRYSILFQERLHELPATLYARNSDLTP